MTPSIDNRGKRMRDSALYKELVQRTESAGPAATSLRALVETTYEESAQVLKTVVRHMPQYTLHDQVHVDNVIDIMGQLIPQDTVEQLSTVEIASLILCAALHDVGMAPCESEVRELLDETSVSDQRRAFSTFCEANEGASSRMATLIREGRQHEVEELRALLLSRFIRETHGDRIRQYIHHLPKDQFIYSHFDLRPRLAEVCFSHTTAIEVVARLPCHELVRRAEHANWRFVATVLRLADILDFDAARTPEVLLNNLGIREHVSIKEWQRHLAVEAWGIESERLAITARCSDPVIEDCIRKYAASVECEFRNSLSLVEGMHTPGTLSLQEKYCVHWPTVVDMSNVGPLEGPDGPLYEYRDLGFTLDKQSVMDLVLGIRLYGDRRLFLRELLQNAVDACRHRIAMHEAVPKAPTYTPFVEVRLTHEGDDLVLEVEDTGVGMDEDIVRDYFAKIGKSYYRSPRFQREAAEHSLVFEHTSVFGIGVLSVFMVSDHLKVRTCHASSPFQHDKSLDIEIDGPDALFWFRRSNQESPGTTARLNLRINPFNDQSHAEQIPPTNGGEPSTVVEPVLTKAIQELAPHVEFPVFVREPAQYVQVVGNYEAPSVPNDIAENVRAIPVNFTKDGPKGLNGVAVVLILDNVLDGLVCHLELSNESFYCDELGERLCDRLDHQHGYIRHVYIDYSARDNGITEAFGVAIPSAGRWSQRGFCVPHPLFVQHSTWPQTTPAGLIAFPFPVLYDIDFSGEFAVNLTADRLRPTSDVRSREVANRVSDILIHLIVQQLDHESAEALARIHAEITKHKSGPEDDIVRRVLPNCIDSHDE
jgi:hypothetical protein